jgi:hypothetical protein
MSAPRACDHGRVDSRQRRFLAVLTALALVALALQVVTGEVTLVFHLTPVFLMAALLLSGRYVAEDTIVRRWTAQRPHAARPLRARWTARLSAADRAVASRRVVAPVPDHDFPGALLMRLLTLAGVASLAVSQVLVASVAAAAPPPCENTPQITDASGDGHHSPTDVTAAWFSEAAGPLQVVIQVRAGTWVPEHDDADTNGAGYAFVFDAGGATRYVRALAAANGTVTYDYGTYAGPGAFSSAGATTGSVAYGTGGTVTLDVPSALGVVSGAVLANPYVVTYDGIVSGSPTWVDHAPGGVAPGDIARGADYTVGSCTPGSTGGGPGGGPTGPAGPGGPGGTAQTTAVLLKGPSRLTGAGDATLTGKVTPARAGLPVTVTRTAGKRSAVSQTSTLADGTFKLVVPVAEVTTVRAEAGGLRSQSLVIGVRSKVRIRFRRSRTGAVAITGTYSPSLPGRAQLIATDAVRPRASRSVSGGTFTLRFAKGKLRRGRYQVVFIPSKARAERSTSNTISVKP